MTQEQLLGEIEDLLRTMPPRATLRHGTEENLSWLGRAAAVIEQWDPLNVPLFRLYLDQFHGVLARNADEGFRKIMTMLHQARNDLRMNTVGPLSVVIQQGMVFDYFEELRGLIATASNELFFIDPYLDSEFVSRYLGHVRQEVRIRLLACKRLSTLLPAAELFVRQEKAILEVRSADGFHDQYLVVDKANCYQSGASFKDGARLAPTTLTQITDAFSAVVQTYEDIWKRAKVELPPMTR